MKQLLLVALFALVAASASAQDRLTSLTFGPSPDQTATMADGTPIVTRYEIVIDRLASTTPPVTAATAIATVDLGKPAPVAGVITISNVAVPVTLTAGNYVARLAVIGPGGRSADLAGPFSQPVLPRPATSFSVVR
jgi:hypothetical protein